MLENKNSRVAGAAGKIACDYFKKQLARRILDQPKLIRFYGAIEQKLLVK